jgi:hypothetical protein
MSARTRPVAVRLVYRDESYAALLQHPPQRLASFANDPFGAHVEQAAAVLTHAREHLVALVRQQRAVQIRRGDAVHPQSIDLVLHQRDQR